MVGAPGANLLILQISNATWRHGYPRKMKFHGIPKSNVVLLQKSSRGVLKVAFVVVGATTFTQRLTEFRRLQTRRRQKITLNQSERSAGQTERYTARWLVHDFVAILVVRRAARCRRSAARCTAVVPSLGRLQLSRPRGCCCYCCYSGVRAGAFVCCCCHRRSRLTIQMARPNSRELETRLLMLLLLYVALAPGLDSSDSDPCCITNFMFSLSFWPEIHALLIWILT